MDIHALDGHKTDVHSPVVTMNAYEATTAATLPPLMVLPTQL